MGINIRTIIIVTLLLVLLIPCFADIKGARDNYIKGNTSDALLMYENWLRINQNSNDYSSVLVEISELKGDIHKISEILEKQIKFVSDRGERKNLYIKVAQLFELSANLYKAQMYYQKAALLSMEKIDFGLLFKSAKTLLLEGELILAESQLEEIIVNCQNRNIIVKARLFFTIIKLLNSIDDDIDYNDLYFDNPESIYLLYLIAEANSETIYMNSFSEKLAKDFEASPEAGLVRNELSELPDIITSLGLLNTNIIIEKLLKYDISPEKDAVLNYMIQAGSFRDPENAHYLSIDLSERGFKPKVEEQTINNQMYYKVLLFFSTKHEMNRALIKLRENGFEGFPVY